MQTNYWRILQSGKPIAMLLNMILIIFTVLIALAGLAEDFFVLFVRAGSHETC